MVNLRDLHKGKAGAKEEPAKAPRPPPLHDSVPIPLDDLIRMGKKDKAELVALARQVCESSSIESDAALFAARDSLGPYRNLPLAISKLTLMDEVFPQPLPAPVEPEPVDAHAMTDFNPGVTAGLAANDFSDAERMAQVIKAIRTLTASGSGSVEELKLKRASVAYDEERQRLLESCNSDEAVLDDRMDGAVDKNKHGKSLNALEAQLVELYNLGLLRDEYKGIVDARNIKRESAVITQPPGRETEVIAPRPSPAHIHPELPLPQKPRPKGDSLVKRFFSSPSLWWAVGLGAFTGVALLTDSFNKMAALINNVMESHRDISLMIRNIWEAKLGFSPLDSAKGVATVLYSLIGLDFVAALISKHFQARRIAKDYAGVSPENFKEMRSYAIGEVAAVVESHGEDFTFLLRKIEEDEKLFKSLDILRSGNAKVFAATMKEAKMPKSVLENMDVIIHRAEAVMVLDRLDPYIKACLAGASDTQRKTVLERVYDSSPLLKWKLEETFCYDEKAKELAAVFGGGNAKGGEKFVAQLKVDYLDVVSKVS